MSRHLLLFFCILISQTLSIPLKSSYHTVDPVANALQYDAFFKKFMPQPITTQERQQLVQLTQTVANKNRARSERSLVPVIIIPSLIGNIMEARLDDAEYVHWYCYDNSDWYTIFLNNWQFCFSENFQLKFENGSYISSRRGVTTRPPHWGSTQSCDFLDEAKTLPVWSDINNILRNASYVDGVNLRAAPYDWRFGPEGLNEWYEATRRLFEESYEKNSAPAAAVSLSMGGPYFVQFLQTVSQEWKDKYVRSFTSLSGAFGGSSFAISALALPPDNGQYGSLSAIVQNLARTWGSIPYLLPSTDVFRDKVFVSVGKVNYTIEDFPRLFNDSGVPASVTDAWKRVRSLQNLSKKPPGVKTNCVYGYGLDTQASFDRVDFKSTATPSTEDGDTTCLREALESCQDWKTKQKEPVILYPIFNMTHGGAVTNVDAIKIFLSEIELL
ncbi:group XV phospholipase A2-like [Planoprotostelium fungivorum]|uniref:Group XV phospholipase A2-like n=1 Tax=Planoprotostelium fungivorum TaxID=1890364 RepID=A0A2P6NBG5_9EUKA|nr:group XV phospholipase A2-like [Planoprotostelium fungivorum]